MRGVKTEVKAGLGDQRLRSGTDAFDVAFVVFPGQPVRQRGVIFDAQALQGVADGKDSAAGTFQRTLVILRIEHAAPPAVHLAVDDIRAPLLRRGA